MLNKYNNALELMQEAGRISVRTIDDGDLLDLIDELDKHGYNCKLDETTDYIVAY